jgi:tungstate transport system substrate-binding protein
MVIQRRALLTLVGSGAAAGLAGCTGVLSSGGSGEGGDGSGGSVASEELVVTTTTSTYDTDLLDELNAAFEDRFGTPVQAISQGTGAALETARSGDADVVVVHARSQEDEFLEEGHGVNRRDLMFNDYVIVGPADDPAGIGGTEEAEEAFATIADEEALFASRGDDSGTHAAERGIWEVSTTDPGGEWYLETGQGMGDTLNQASQQGGYTLADRGTFVSQRDEIELEIIVQGPVEGGSELLANPYGIIAANPAVHGNRNYDLAMAYIGFLTGPEGQQLIGDYELDGEQLFFAGALSEDPNYGQYAPDDRQPDEDADAAEGDTGTDGDENEADE